jgi:hypothetical protein
MEHFLMERALRPLLGEVSQQRAKEVETISRHIEISLNAIIDRVQLQASELLQQKEAGSTEPGIEGRLKQFEDRLDELYGRLEQRRLELLQERQCTVADIQLHGRAWVLPHPDRSAPGVAPMVRDDDVERIAVEAVIAYEQARGWEVVSVELEDKGFDLISRRFHPEDAQTAVGLRFIEVKGRAEVGDVALSSNEYRTAQRLGKEYWLYVVYNCATTPEIYLINNPASLPWEPLGQINHYYVDSEAILSEARRQSSPQTSKFEQAFREVWDSRLAEWGEYNILVEGASDKAYLELAAQRYQAAHGLDLLEGGAVRIVAGAGTKRFAPYFGMLQSLEERGIKFVVMLDGDEAGAVAAEAMARFKAQKNRHYFQLERKDYKDKGGKSWEVEIEDLLAFRLIDAFVTQYPDAVEARFQMGPVTKIVINGKPVEREGQTYDFKMMLADYVRQQATVDDLAMLVALLKKARQCMGLKE